MYQPSAGGGAQPLISNAGGQCSDWSQSGERGLDTLRDAQRTANDAEAIGVGVLGQLHDQRQQLHQAIDWREDMDGDLAMSSRLIRRMSVRATYMKCILGSIVLLLLGAIFFILYVKLIKPNHSSHHNGRMLQAAEEDPTIGVGIIVLVAIGGTFLIACCLACAARPATRITVCCVLSVLYGILLLILFLAPRESGPSSSLAPAPPPPPSTNDDLTDVGYMMRVFFATAMSLTAVVALVGLIVVHLMKSTRVEAHATEPVPFTVDMYTKP